MAQAHSARCAAQAYERLAILKIDDELWLNKRLAKDGLDGPLYECESPVMPLQHLKFAIELRQVTVGQAAPIVVHFGPNLLPIGFTERTVVNAALESMIK
jgi:hypothetical protein